MSILNRSNKQSINLWLEVTTGHPGMQGKVQALQSFLHAPNNAFLALNILSKLIDMESDLNDGLPKYQKLKLLIDTAKWCSSAFRKNFPEGTEEFSYLDLNAFMKSALVQKQIVKSKISKDDFIRQSVWHGYFDEYPIYTCLFFPYVDSTELSTSFNLALKVHQFLKIQALKLIAETVTEMTTSRLRDLGRALRKLIQTNIYQHLNTSEYKRVQSECDLVSFLNKDYTPESDTHEASPLVDNSSFIQHITEDDKRWIMESRTSLKNFFSIFCGTPNNSRKPQARGKDNQVRAKYNRKFGLVLSSEIKSRHQLEKLELDSTRFDLNARVIKERPIRESGNANLDSFLEDDRNDDLECETQTQTLIWPQTAPCELDNPIASLNNTQRMLPHIALSNQQLKARIPKTQITSLLTLIKRTSTLLKQGIQIIDDDHILITQKAIFLLLTGRIIQKIETKPDFFLKEDSIFINSQATTIRVAFPQYENRSSFVAKELFIDSDIEDLTLHLPNTVTQLIKPIFDAAKNRFITSSSTLDLSNHSKIDLGDQDLHFNDLRQGVQRSYSEASQSDSWLLSVFTWQTSGLENTQKHYASIPLRQAQAIFEKHCRDYLGIELPAYQYSNLDNQRIGSPYFLNKQSYRAINNELWKNFSPLINQVEFNSLSNEELVFRFNSLALYVDAYGAFSCAIRNIRDPIIRLEEVSLDGLYRVNDKNKFDGFNTRITFVPNELQSMLEIYGAVRKKVLIHLNKTKMLVDRDKNIVKNNRLFFIKTNSKSNKLQIKVFTRTLCRDELYWQAINDESLIDLNIELKMYSWLRELKTNVNRHYLRGRLLELGVPGYFIDAYMGHWHAGTQPWGKMSIFDKSSYFRIIQTNIPSILRELGFSSKRGHE
jgi:hypothetical protein